MVPTLALALTLACSGEDSPPGDTDDGTGSTTDSPTSVADDAPPLDDSTGGGPGVDTGTGTDTSMTTGTGEDTSSPTTDTTDAPGSSSDDGVTGCASDDECTDAGAPFCVGTMCSPCGAAVDPDAACASKFPDTPLCVDSTCVQCTAAASAACTGTTPLCDADANACVGCTTHADCPDSACHIPSPDPARVTALDGACFDPATVVHVDITGGQDFGNLGAAMASFAAGDEGVIIVHATGEYSDAVFVTEGRVLAILGAPGEIPQVLGVDASAAHVSVTGASSIVFLERIALYGNNGLAGAAVQVDSGRAHIQRTSILDNTGGAVSAANGALVHVENSFVGGSVDNAEAIAIGSASDASILYSTVLTGLGSAARSLRCTNAGTVDVRNSILLGETEVDSVQCSGGTFLNNASDQGLGVGNATVPELDGNNETWWFLDYLAGDVHLTGGFGAMEFCLVGVWEDGDPAIDIDGDLRPTMNGLVDCAGADIP